MQGVDEELTIGEVDVEGALRHAGPLDDGCDAETSQAHAVGDLLAGVQQRLAGAAAFGGDRLGAVLRLRHGRRRVHDVAVS